jgi:hypothetical protein
MIRNRALTWNREINRSGQFAAIFVGCSFQVFLCEWGEEKALGCRKWEAFAVIPIANIEKTIGITGNSI